jgi:hypothetical protein
LEALSEDEAVLRATDNDHFIVAIEMAVGMCECCKKCGPLRKCMDYLHGDAASLTRHTLFFTPEEVALMFKGVTPGAITSGFGASINAGGHLATLRKFKTFHTPTELALLEIFPFVAACLTHEREYLSGFWGSCCGFTKHNSVLRRYNVPLKTPEGEWVDRYFVGDNKQIEEDGEAVYDAVTRLGLDGDVKLLKDPNADDSAQPLAVKYGASPHEPIFWANTVQNAKDGIKGRIDDVMVPMTTTETQDEELMTIVRVFVERFKGSALPMEILASLLFLDWKSKKWTEARAIRALNDLAERYCPGYRFKGKVKLEPAKKGKPPRLIISDQDAGQVMAWMVMGLLERYIFTTYKSRSIKGMSKKARMERLARDFHMNKHGEKGEFVEKMLASILENDGSAWDGCMRQRLRMLVEEPFIEAATEMVNQLVLPAGMYSDEHLESTKGKTITLRFPMAMRDLQVKSPESLGKDDTGVELSDFVALKKIVKVEISAIRRSGHRGTSILNWISNHMLWVWVLFGKHGVCFAHPDRRRCKDIFGRERNALFCFEGDDSILAVTGSFTQDEIDKLTSRWKALGHRPKLFLRKPGDAAEFCGWKFLVDEYGLKADGFTVDVPRQFRNGHTCIAPEAVDAVVRGNRVKFAKVAVPGMLTRAYTLAETAPSLAQYFLGMAEHFNGGVVTDANFEARELYRLGEIAADLPEMWRTDIDNLRNLEDMVDMRSIIEKIYSAVAVGKLACADEAKFAVAHGWVEEEAEYELFVQLLESAGYSQHNVLDAVDLPGKFGEA